MVSIASEDSGRVHAHSTASALTEDFERLIRIFDRHLAAHPQADAAIRAHVAEAKVAAERGLELTRQLARTLKEDLD